MSSKNKKAVVAARRVYKYTDQEGNIYYSFYRAPMRVGPPLRLTLESRLGVHLMNFVVALKRKVESEEMGEG